MRRFYFLASLLALLYAVPAQAQFKAGDWDLTLSGGGNSDRDVHNTAFNFTASPGYFITDNIEIGLRQTGNYADGFGGLSAAFADYHFNVPIGTHDLVPFVGANAGYSYGTGFTDSWRVGPEAGLKFFLTSDAYLYGRAAYDFATNEGFNDGGWLYEIGVGLKF